MDKIFIKDLSVRGLIGIDGWERTTPQEILINVVLFMDLAKAGHTDHIEDTLSYSQVALKITRLAETAQRLTVEALAADIAEICLAESGVARVKVRVEKPGAVRFARSAGVEIVRSHHISGRTPD